MFVTKEARIVYIYLFVQKKKKNEKKLSLKDFSS